MPRGLLDIPSSRSPGSLWKSGRGGKAYAKRPSPEIKTASVAKAPGSLYREQYFWVSLLTLLANRSMTGWANTLKICCATSWLSELREGFLTARSLVRLPARTFANCDMASNRRHLSGQSTTEAAFPYVCKALLSEYPPDCSGRQPPSSCLSVCALDAPSTVVRRLGASRGPPIDRAG